MNYSEEQLRAARLAEPSHALDQRMQDVFESAGCTQPPLRRAIAWPWIGAFAATGIAAAVAMVAIRPRSMPANPNPPPVLCSIEPQGSMRQLLLDLPASNRPPPHFSVSVSTQ